MRWKTVPLKHFFCPKTIKRKEITMRASLAFIGGFILSFGLLLCADSSIRKKQIKSKGEEK